jgi:hypothetical protein
MMLPSSFGTSHLDSWPGARVIFGAVEGNPGGSFIEPTHFGDSVKIQEVPMK